MAARRRGRGRGRDPGLCRGGADASVAMDGLGAVVFAMPLVAVGVVVSTAVDVFVDRGCARSNFWVEAMARGHDRLRRQQHDIN